MYSIVDIETTGGNHKTGRITEIAIVKHDGLGVTETFSSLINPECSIPYFISNLTGITNDMVADAPKFYEVAKDIIEFLEDSIFVAHNVSFDYNFIKQEFKDLGYDFQVERVCTVKSARKMFPGRKSYSLGKICNDLGISLTNHHRALADATATAELFQLILNENGGTHANLMEKDIRFSLLNPAFDRTKLSHIPEEPGVYYFLNEQSDVIYIGKSNNIRKRVMSHFRNTRSKRAIEMISNTADVDYVKTGSELIALLQESDEIKQIKPQYNRAQKRTFENVGVFARDSEEGYIDIYIDPINKRNPDPVATFKSAENAKNALRKWTEQFGLCQKYTGIHKHTGPCFGYHIGECAGACLNEEDPDIYNHRVKGALSYLNYRHNSFIIIDQGRSKEEVSIVLVENGHYKGFGFADTSEAITSVESVYEIIEERTDNRDVKRIIRSYLQTKKIKKLIPL